MDAMKMELYTEYEKDWQVLSMEVAQLDFVFRSESQLYGSEGSNLEGGHD